MANWDIDWRPTFGFSFEPEYKTVVSVFDGGTEQRRQKWTRPRYHFQLSFDNRAYSLIDEIMVFFNACGGAYDPFNFPNYGQRIKGSRLACVNSNPDTITDSSSEFVKRGFDTDHGIWIAGSGQSNDGNYGVQTVIAGTVTLDTVESIAAESANASLIIYKSYYVRFNEDSFRQEFLTDSISGVRTLELIEVIS